MNAVIVCVSVSHGNTKKVADAMAEVLGAEVLEPEQVDPAALARFDLVGFGSGIFSMSFHPRLVALVDRLPTTEGGKAFVFCTHGGPEIPVWPYTKRLSNRLSSKGFDVAGSFSCRGYDTWLPLRLVGGINRGRPNDRDLGAAQSFAARMRGRAATPNSRSRPRSDNTVEPTGHE